ncbi:MAG: hypothetical protein KGQ66_14020 [Acidobacteriota bacterium]|nr:hypothetical protein [Acidobacteriota bacterium]
MSSVAEWWQKETFIPQPDWAPPTASMPTRKRRRWPRVVVAAVIAGLLGAVVVLGVTAWRYQRDAARWRDLEQAQALDLARVQAQMDLSQTSTGQLRACITALQHDRPGFVAVILGETSKIPAVCQTAEALAGGSQP